MVRVGDGWVARRRGSDGDGCGKGREGKEILVERPFYIMGGG